MSNIFIYAGKKYINLSHVTSVSRRKDGKFDIFIDDKLLDEGNADFSNKILSIIAPQGSWESLSTCTEDDGSISVHKEPVLAWGLSALGCLVPITPTELDGGSGVNALKKEGDDRIYTDFGTYDDLNAWIDSERKP